LCYYCPCSNLLPVIQIFGAEPAGAADAFRSKRDGVLGGHTEAYPCVTIADGLRTTLGSNTFPIVQVGGLRDCGVFGDSPAAAFETNRLPKGVPKGAGMAKGAS
jgi:hypothetical protein